MESISSRNLPLVLHTLNQIELAINKNWDGSGDPLDVSAWLGTDDTL